MLLKHLTASVIASLLLVGHKFVSAQYPLCPVSWVPFGDQKCYKLNPTNLPWDIAEASCGDGATLFSVHEYPQLLKIIALLVPPINQNPQPFNCMAIWTGLNDKDNEQGNNGTGAWRWSDGSAFDWQGWFDGFPIPDSESGGNKVVDNDCVFVVPGVSLMNGACFMPMCSICQVDESTDTSGANTSPSSSSTAS